MKSKELENQLENALQTINQGKYDEAESILKKELDLIAKSKPKNGDDNEKEEFRLDMLLLLAEIENHRGNFNEAYNIASNVFTEIEELEINHLKHKAEFLLTSIYAYLGLFKKALACSFSALAYYEEQNDRPKIATSKENIGSIYGYLENCDLSIEYMYAARTIQEELGEKKKVSSINAKIGAIYANLGQSLKALEFLLDSQIILEEFNNKKLLGRVYGNIGTVYARLKERFKALEYYFKALDIHKELGEKSGIVNILGNIGTVYAQTDFEQYNPSLAEKYLLDAIALGEEIASKNHLYAWYKSLAEFYKAEHRWKESLNSFERYHELEKEVISEEATKQAQQLENQRKIEEAERDRQVKLARFQEQEKILHNILPEKIADRILDGEKTIADRLEEVTIFFSDIVGFTAISQNISPEELVNMLNDIFSEFDRIAKTFGLEKIKTIGDAYMAVAGAPIPQENHATCAANFALEIMNSMQKYRKRTGSNLEIRVGLHSGYAVAGIIGENKFSYDLWGDTVNVASRMESHGINSKIHVSEDFVKLLTNTTFRFEERGEMEIKGKGIMKTFFLIGK